MTVQRWLGNCETKITRCSDRVTSPYVNACVQVVFVHVLYILRLCVKKNDVKHLTSLKKKSLLII